MTRAFTDRITRDELLKLLRYDSATGQFYWLAHRYPAKVGTVAGCINRLGYCCITTKRTRYLAHRLAWFYVHGAWPTKLIDHIDGNPSNNAIANLREANDAQNQHNVNWRGYSYKPSSSAKNPFQVQIRINKKQRYVGIFPTAEQARAAYVAASIKHFGQFSFHNRGEN